MSLEKPPIDVAPNSPLAACTTSVGRVTLSSTGMAGASRPALAAAGRVAVMPTGMSRGPRLGKLQVKVVAAVAAWAAGAVMATSAPAPRALAARAALTRRTEV